jgi:hypothetical protein
MGKLAFALGGLVVVVVALSGAIGLVKIIVAAGLVVLTILGLLTEKPRMCTKFPTTKRTTTG